MNYLRRIKLRHLETFVEVARQKSVGRAAAALNLTQPSVTRTIRELEGICGVALIEKDGRGIRLSRHGELFVRHAGSGLAAVRTGLNTLSETGLDGGPPVRIGALPTVSATVLPDAVARYGRSDLRARLRIVTGDNHVLLDHLREGELDLVAGRLPAPENMRGLVFEPLYRDRVVFVIDADHPLAGQGRIPIEALDAYPVLLPPVGSIIRPFVDRLFLEHGITEPLQAIETVSDSFGRAFVRAHQGIWIISRGVVSDELANGSFTVLPFDTESSRGAVGLVTRADETLSAAAEAFTGFLHATVEESEAFQHYPDTP